MHVLTGSVMLEPFRSVLLPYGLFLRCRWLFDISSSKFWQRLTSRESTLFGRFAPVDQRHQTRIIGSCSGGFRPYP